MGQKNLRRTQFIPRVTVLDPKSDDKQDVDFTGYFEINDVVDVIDVDANGNIISTLADNLTILAIVPGQAVTLSASVDTSAATGTPMIRCQQIDDGQEAIDRLYRRRLKGDIQFVLKQDILAQELNTPSAGQTRFEVDDVSFFRAGDTVDILADEGIVNDAVTILSVSPNADDTNNRATIVIDELADTSTFTSPIILNTSITIQEAIERNQARIDEIDRPVENEDMHTLNGVGESTLTVFETVNLFKSATSKVYLDGSKRKLGTAGTRAAATQISGAGSITFTAMILGVLGNEIEIEIVNAAGLTVTVTKTFKESAGGIVSAATQYLIQVNNNSGVATVKDIADAINADSVAKRIVQAKWNGNATDTYDAIAAFPLTGGLDDGTGDYAELEQIKYLKNGILSIVNTGYKWISFHIRPGEQNRMDHPPEQDEEVEVEYRRPSENIDR